MKLLIASDIHGSAAWCEKLLEAFEREEADKLLLLGDILYHGPRNPLPDGYAPHKVAEMLNGVAEKVICVRGNCDSEVDQMVLGFPCLSDYALVCADGVNIYLSHGHRAVPPMRGGDVYVTGHTHVPLAEREGFLHLNPGSVSLPKENSGRGYILYSNKKFSFRTLDGEEYKNVSI